MIVGLRKAPVKLKENCLKESKQEILIDLLVTYQFWPEPLHLMHRQRRLTDSAGMDTTG